MIFCQRHVVTGDAILCLQFVEGTYLEQKKRGGNSFTCPEFLSTRFVPAKCLTACIGPEILIWLLEE